MKLIKIKAGFDEHDKQQYWTCWDGKHTCRLIDSKGKILSSFESFFPIVSEQQLEIVVNEPYEVDQDK